MGLDLINVRKVFRNYGVETIAVDDFNINVQKGQFLTLLGPSGCGKTTTLRMIAGFEIPSSGKIILDGVDITNLPPNKRNISMVFQSYALFPHMTVEENIAFGLKIMKLKKEEVARKVSDMIEIVGLKGLEKRRPEQLSGGQQQRVALARSLVMEPGVLLLDEPLSNLDAKLRETMRTEIRKIQKQLNITAVYVTHDQIEAMSMSDVVVVMKDGKIMQSGTPYEIYSRPSNTFVADFIGKVNLIDGVVNNVNDENAAIASDIFYPKEITVKNVGKFVVGDKVKIVVRPEAFSLVQKEYSINGTVQSIVFLGSLAEMEVKSKSGDILKATINNPMEFTIPKVGEEIKLYFSSKSVWVIKE